MIKLNHIFGVFVKIGFIAFGGPAAHAALMEKELVGRLKWISTQTFLDFLGAVNLIPGPNSTQLTMLTGYQLRGFRGMLAAGFGFILPATLITGVLAWLYVSTGHIPVVESLFFGIKPAVIAVIAGAVISLGTKALKNYWLGVLGVITLASTLVGLGEIVAIIGAGLIGMAGFTLWKLTGNMKSAVPGDKLSDKPGNKPGDNNSGSLRSFIPLALLGAGTAAVPYSLLKLFLVFLKIGAVLFGSGYVLVAYIDGELVEKLGWLTREQLLDAIAIGQFTPGPILTAATFVGFLFDGVPGALVATAGIFLPSFVFIMILYPIIPKLRKSPFTAAFLDAVNIAAVAVMLSVTIIMTIEAGSDWRTALILAMALVAVFGINKAGSVWIIAGGALMGVIVGGW